MIETNYEKLFLVEDAPNFGFTYPEEFNKDEYKKFLKLAYEKFRFDVANRIQQTCNGQSPTDEEMKNAINGCDLPNIKGLVYEKMGFPLVDGEKASTTIIKAYTNHMLDQDWQREVFALQKSHKKELFGLQDRPKVPKSDPLEDYLAAKKSLSVKRLSPEEQEKEDEEQKKIDEEAAKAPTGPGFGFMEEDKQKDMVKAFMNKIKKKEDKPEEEKKEEEAPRTDAVQDPDDIDGDGVPEEPDNAPLRSAPQTDQPVEAEKKSDSGDEKKSEDAKEEKSDGAEEKPEGE